MTDDARRERAIAEVRPYIERARSFSGWSFRDLAFTLLDDDPPWDYEALVTEHAKSARSVIDLGTGGGEFFARVVPHMLGRACALEEWHVNAPVAHARLAPLGAHVVWASTQALPFRNGAFDLIIDRHEEIVPVEVIRVLAPGGTFITQQVANENWRELDAFFPHRTQFPDHYTLYAQAFRDAGFNVETQYHERRIAYAGIGEVAFMMLISPWELPGFDPVAEIDALLALEDAHRTDNGIELTMARYLLVASR